MLTPTQTRRLLQDLKLRPRKRLGQNFLIDSNIARKSLALANVNAGDVIVEVGPGLGALTGRLLQAGAHVYAVEIDSTLAKFLDQTIKPRFPDTFDLLQADAVKFPLGNLQKALGSKRGVFKIVANLPYAISTPWMDAVLTGPLPNNMILLLQRETAGRFTADCGTKDFGAISIFLQAAYQRHKGHAISRTCFYPVPKVDSVLLNLSLKKNPFIYSKKTRLLIRSLFTQRRKQIGSLAKQYPVISPWIEHLAASGIDSKIRPEAVPLEHWRVLTAGC